MQLSELESETGTGSMTRTREWLSYPVLGVSESTTAIVSTRDASLDSRPNFRFYIGDLAKIRKLFFFFPGVLLAKNRPGVEAREMLARKKPRVSLRSTDSRASEVFNLSVQLQCARTDLTEKRDIKLESPPHTYTQNILAVKKQVEKQFSIPVCVQTLSYHGHVVKNGIKLSDLRVRNGDIFHVDYLAEGDCTDIMEIISWLEQLSIAISCRSPGVGLNDTVAFGIQRELLEDLEAFFSPWEDPTSRSYVNKLLFADNDGIGMIMKIYGFLLQMSWNKMDENLKNFEENITRSLECFTETVPLCRLLIQHNIIQMATRSLLQVKLKEDKGIYDLDTSGDQYQQSCLAETVYASIGILSK